MHRMKTISHYVELLNFSIDKKLNISLFSSLFMVSAVLILRENWVLIFFALYLFFLLFYNVHSVIFVWIMFLPFENLLRNSNMLSPFYLLLVFGILYLMLMFFKQKSDYFQLKIPFLFVVGLLVLSVFPLFNLGFQVVTMRPIISLFSVLVFFLVIVSFLQNDKSRLQTLINSIIMISLLSIIVSVITTEGYRFSVGGNVRSFANILGLSLILLFYKILNLVKMTKDRKAKIRLVFLFTAWGFIAYFLLLTLSRGVILAVVLSIVSYIVFIVFKKFDIALLFRLFIGVVFLFFLVILIANTDIFQNYSIGRLFYRFQLEFFINNVRFEFWLYAIQSLNFTEFLFGAGLMRFQEIVAEGGYKYYAHSIYIDALISLGITGFLYFIGYHIISFYNAFVNRNAFSIMILVYTFFSFSTHGNLISKYFWLNFAIIIGYNIAFSNNLSISKGRNQ